MYIFLVFALFQFSIVFDTKDLNPFVLSLVLPLHFCLTSVSFDDPFLCINVESLFYSHLFSILIAKTQRNLESNKNGNTLIPLNLILLPNLGKRCCHSHPDTDLGVVFESSFSLLQSIVLSPPFSHTELLIKPWLVWLSGLSTGL